LRGSRKALHCGYLSSHTPLHLSSLLACPLEKSFPGTRRDLCDVARILRRNITVCWRAGACADDRLKRRQSPSSWLGDVLLVYAHGRRRAARERRANGACSSPSKTGAWRFVFRPGRPSHLARRTGRRISVRIDKWFLQLALYQRLAETTAFKAQRDLRSRSSFRACSLGVCLAFWYGGWLSRAAGRRDWPTHRISLFASATGIFCLAHVAFITKDSRSDRLVYRCQLSSRYI